jgi:spore maturation protein CgeB
MELTPKTIKHLRKSTIRLINFNPDNPFIFSGKGSGNSNVTKSISLYSEHFTYDNRVKVKIESEFGMKCTIVPFGFDPEVITIEELNKVEEIKAVCFVGNPDTYRTQVLSEILDNGLQLHVYGHDWSKYLNHPNLTIHGPVYEKEYYRTLRKYRVQLNIMRVHNLESHNMRSIEVPGCGGIMLAPQTSDHDSFFIENHEVFFYSDIVQLIEKANKILVLDNTTSQMIRKNAINKVVSRFSYQELTKKFITE